MAANNRIGRETQIVSLPIVLCFDFLPVFRRCLAGIFLENLGKVIHIRKAGMLGYGLNLQHGGIEKLHGMVHTFLIHVIGESLPGLLLEECRKIGWANILHGSQGVQTQIGRQVKIDIGDGFLNGRRVPAHGMGFNQAAIGAENTAHKFLGGIGGGKLFDLAGKVRRNPIQVNGMHSTLFRRFSQQGIHYNTVVLQVPHGIGQPAPERRPGKSGQQKIGFMGLDLRNSIYDLISYLSMFSII